MLRCKTPSCQTLYLSDQFPLCNDTTVINQLFISSSLLCLVSPPVSSYMLVNIIISVDVHTGFDFPIFLQHLDPTGNFGGSPKHDMHHQRPLTNFGPYFNHLDKLYGSFCPPMSAGGKKSKALVDYERKVRECKKNL